MDQYLLAISGIIIFSLIVIFYIRISSSSKLSSTNKKEVGDQEISDSDKYDHLIKDRPNPPAYLKSQDSSNSSDPLRHLKSSDFTLLE